MNNKKYNTCILIFYKTSLTCREFQFTAAPIS